MNVWMKNNFYDFIESQMGINKIDFSGFDSDAFNDKYKIYHIITRPNEKKERPWIQDTRKLFQDLEVHTDIQSISYIGGNSAYVLLKRDAQLVVEDVLSREEYEKFEVLEFKLDASPKCSQTIETQNMSIAYNLLFNALAQTKDAFTNLEGKLYLWGMKKGNEIKLMRYSVNRSGLLLRGSESFYPAKYCRNPKAQCYRILAGKNGTRLLIKESRNRCGEDVYVRGAFEKGSLMYDDFYVHENEKHKRSRMDLLHDLILNFNMEYKGMAQLKFVQVPAKTQDIEELYNKANKEEREKDFCQLGRIALIVSPDVEDGEIHVDQLERCLKECGATVVRRVNRNHKGLNIIVTHEKAYYEKKFMDPHRNRPKDTVIQGVTIERLIQAGEIEKKCIARKLLCELIFKKEIKEKYIPAWEFGDYEFYIAMRNRSVLGEDVHHCLMKVTREGRIIFIDNPEKIDVAYTKHTNSSDLIDWYGQPKNGNVCIVSKEGELNKITLTKYLPVTDPDIRKKYEQGRKARISTAVEVRQDKRVYPHLGKSVLDIDGKIHYTIGANKNPNKNMQKVNNIYKIEQIDNIDGEESVFIPEIIYMLKRQYIRTDNTDSVRPYPFKHLIEHMRSLYNASGLYIK